MPSIPFHPATLSTTGAPGRAGWMESHHATFPAAAPRRPAHATLEGAPERALGEPYVVLVLGPEGMAMDRKAQPAPTSDRSSLSDSQGESEYALG